MFGLASIVEILDNDGADSRLEMYSKLTFIYTYFRFNEHGSLHVSKKRTKGH